MVFLQGCTHPHQQSQFNTFFNCSISLSPSVTLFSLSHTYVCLLFPSIIMFLTPSPIICSHESPSYLFLSFSLSLSSYKSLFLPLLLFFLFLPLSHNLSLSLVLASCHCKTMQCTLQSFTDYPPNDKRRVV